MISFFSLRYSCKCKQGRCQEVKQQTRSKWYHSGIPDLTIDRNQQG